MKSLLINWSFICNYRGEYIVTGEIYNDDRFADGTVIYTTPILTMDFQAKKFKTKNTEYNFEYIIH